MSERAKVTLPKLWEMKRNGQKITMITAYDYPTGVWSERASLDIVLVGDSMAMTVLGYSTTLPATMAELIAHTQAVTRGCKTPFSWEICLTCPTSPPSRWRCKTPGVS